MSLLPDSASFFEQVQSFFLACRGDGVSLSDADARCLLEWESTGAPAHVVVQGIRSSLARHVFDGKIVSRPRSLRSCRREVEAEISKWRALKNGSGTDTPTPLPANEHTESPGEKAPESAEPSDIHRMAQNYSEQRRRKAQINLAQLCEDLNLPPQQRHFLEALLAEDISGERIRRAENGAYVFALRNAPLERRREAISSVRQAVGRREKLETPRSWALRLHDGLAQTARSLLTKNPSRTDGQNR